MWEQKMWWFFLLSIEHLFGVLPLKCAEWWRSDIAAQMLRKLAGKIHAIHRRHNGCTSSTAPWPDWCGCKVDSQLDGKSMPSIGCTYEWCQYFASFPNLRANVEWPYCKSSCCTLSTDAIMQQWYACEQPAAVSPIVAPMLSEWFHGMAPTIHRNVTINPTECRELPIWLKHLPAIENTKKNIH